MEHNYLLDIFDILLPFALDYSTSMRLVSQCPLRKTVMKRTLDFYATSYCCHHCVAFHILGVSLDTVGVEMHE